MKSRGGGEIVQVHGGHILRSTGRKDRHSKVCTSKGARDRRVRLSAHTAIQFYDVQDRLGYDRPSKAVDWLINKAKTAIDNLAELPPWDPKSSESNDPVEEKMSQSNSGFGFEANDCQLGQSFLAQSMDTESMKSFFPTSSETHGPQSMDFHSYTHGIMSRDAIQTEDLCLSLQSPQDPNTNNSASTDQALFSGSGPVNFEASYPKMVDWNGENRGGYMFNSITMPHQSMICHSSAFSHREPLQSSFTSLFRAWDHHGITSTEHQNSHFVNQSLISRAQFGSDGSSRFQVPARIHGEDELGLVSNKTCSASPNSLH